MTAGKDAPMGAAPTGCAFSMVDVPCAKCGDAVPCEVGTNAPTHLLVFCTECRCRLLDAPALPPGYELLRELGRGGMGAVYLVRHLALGVERAEQALTQADLCLWVVDRTQEQPVLPPATLASAFLVVCNKADLADQWREWDFSGPSWIVSALTGQGLTELAAAMVRQLVPEPPPPGAAVPFTEAVCRQIQRSANGNRQSSAIGPGD